MWNRLLTLVIVVSVLAALGVLTYIVATPGLTESFTEFSVLDPQGGTDNYTKVVQAGQEATVILSIVNHEGREITYRVETLINGDTSGGPDGIVLPDEGRFIRETGFVPREPGPNTMVEFYLYRDDESQPCLDPLVLWINVV